MCRGVSLGICCAQGCDQQIRCQDTGGYCPDHDPYVYSWDDDDEEVPMFIDPVDDPAKRRTYDLSRLEVGIRDTEALIEHHSKRLAAMRASVRELRKASEGDE